MSRARQYRRIAGRYPHLCGPSDAYLDRQRSLRISAAHAEVARRSSYDEEITAEEHDEIWSHVDPPDSLCAVMSFARSYPWSKAILYPADAAARVVDEMEPLLPKVRELLLAALTASARHAGDES